MTWVKVHTAPNLALAWLVKESLVEAGVDARIRGEGRPSIAGEIPLPDAVVDVIVPTDSLLRARAVLTRIDTDAAEAPAWTCPACGEENPGNFETCWTCEGARGA